MIRSANPSSISVFKAVGLQVQHPLPPDVYKTPASGVRQGTGQRDRGSPATSRSVCLSVEAESPRHPKPSTTPAWTCLRASEASDPKIRTRFGTVGRVRQEQKPAGPGSGIADGQVVRVKP
jgi:hypothetical protein